MVQARYRVIVRSLMQEIIHVQPMEICTSVPDTEPDIVNWEAFHMGQPFLYQKRMETGLMFPITEFRDMHP